MLKISHASFLNKKDILDKECLSERASSIFVYANS